MWPHWSLRICLLSATNWSRLSYSLKESCFLAGKWYLVSKVWALSMCTVTRLSLCVQAFSLCIYWHFQSRFTIVAFFLLFSLLMIFSLSSYTVVPLFTVPLSPGSVTCVQLQSRSSWCSSWHIKTRMPTSLTSPHADILSSRIFRGLSQYNKIFWEQEKPHSYNFYYSILLVVIIIVAYLCTLFIN